MIMGSKVACAMAISIFILAGATFVASAEDTFRWSGVRGGHTMTKDECRWPVTSVWVVVAGKGECLRYFHAGLGATNPQAHLFIHGDFRAANYRTSAGKIQARVDDEHRGIKTGHIRLSRPGILGSSGNYRKNRRSLREARLVNAAIDGIKMKHRIGRFDLTGQSSGGRLVGILLTMRDDIRCAVSASGGLAQRQLIALRGRKWKRFIVDPISIVAKIPKGPNRRIILLGDQWDQVVPFVIQQSYHQAIVAGGHRTLLIATRGKARGKNYHGLTSVALRVARWCGDGLDDTEIQERVARIPNRG